MPIFVNEDILVNVGVTTGEIERIIEPRKKPRDKILVVDDDETLSEFVSRLLTSEGYEVDTAIDGSDALEKIKGKKYNLLLTGIRMPRIDGFELYKHVKKIAPSLAKKTIVVSGSVKATDTKEFLSRNKLPYMSKPFSAKKLVNKVNRMLTEDK